MLTDFAEHFDNAYEEVFNKVLVAKEIMNTRFEPTLRYGESVERFAYSIDNVLVRSVTRGSASTIDTITDSTELLTINEEYEIAFHLSDGEITQAGPLNPGSVIGKQAAVKLATHLDGRCFAEVLNAEYDFDNGDLTGGSFTSSGVPFALNTTTVPQMVSRMPAKLMNKNNIDATSNTVLVVDALAASDITQYLLGKSIDLAGSTFKNGYVGPVHNAEMYISENLTGEVTLVVDVATADEVIVLEGATWTAKASPSVAGEFDVAGSVDAQGAILENMINGSATGQDSATGYYEISAALRNGYNSKDISASYDTATDTLSIKGRGRLNFSTTMSGATVEMLHAYFGKRGAIDLVIQDMKEVDMRKTADRRGYNIFSSYLAGKKTFADGAKKFLDVLIDVE